MDQERERIIEGLLRRVAKEVDRQHEARPKDRSCFDTGVSFHPAAFRCAVAEDSGPQTISAPTSPLICCLAFACELYLKALLISRRRPSQGHGLVTLFNALHADDSKAVKEAYEQATGRKSIALAKDLATLSKAFVEWRYIFETGKVQISIHRLANVAQAILRTILSTRPEWEVRDHLKSAVLQPMPEDVALVISLGGGRMVRAVIEP